MRNIPFFGSINNSLCHRMRKMLFQAGCNTKQVFFGTVAECFDFCNRRLCFCQCTCLIKYNGICLCNCLQEFAAFYGNIIKACFTDRRKYADRHRQFQCTGEIYHQYRQCLGNIACDQIGQTGTCQCIWNQTVCQMFCFSFYVGFQFFRFFDHCNDLFKLTSAIYFFDTDGQFAFFHNSSRIRILLCIFLYRNRLTCQGCLIYHCISGRYLAIERNDITHMDNNLVSCLDLICRNQDLLTVFYHPYFGYMQ